MLDDAQAENDVHPTYYGVGLGRARPGDADDGGPRGLHLLRLDGGGASISGVRVLAAVCALFAVVLMIVAIAGMVTGRPGARAGGVIRVGGAAAVRGGGRAERRVALSRAAATPSAIDQLWGCQPLTAHSPGATSVTVAIATCHAGWSPW